MAIATPTSKLTWEKPTTYTGGKPLLSQDIKEYRLIFTRADGHSIQHNVVGSTEMLLGASTLITPGDWIVKIYTVGVSGAISDAATPISFTYVSEVPNPPVNFTLIY